VRKVLAGSLAAMAVGGLSFVAVPMVQVSGAQNLNCGDFQFQEDAQAVLDQDPSDPNGLDAHPGPADGNDQAGGDGIACEELPHRGTSGGETTTPTPAPAPAPAPATPTRGNARFTG
jgi:hypothetical protein